MKLLIGGKEYELEFGLDFIAELDKRYTAKQEGLEFGVGVEMATSYLRMKNPTVLEILIKAATSTEKSKPASKDIKAYLEEQAANDKLEDLFNQFEDEMTTAPFLKGKLQQFNKELKRAK